jgi:transcriptional regulator with XRE-family HTH domain
MLASENALGSFVRGRRQELRLTLAALAKATGYSLGYLSRLELGQIPDGPSLACLERVAAALKLDLLTLTHLKDTPLLSGRASEKTAAGPPATVILSEQEQEILSVFRSADEPAQQFLLGEIRLFQSLWSPAGTPVGGDLSRGFERTLERFQKGRGEFLQRCGAIARAYRDLGDQLMDFGRAAEALPVYQSAAAILELLLGPHPALALVQFRLGRVYLSLETKLARGDAALTVGHQARTGHRACHLEDAARCFARASVGFRAREAPHRGITGDEEDELRGREPENLVQWALAMNQQADLMQTGPDRQAVAAVFPVDMHPVYLQHAQARRQEAQALYGDWMEELQQRPPSEERDQQLAEAHHRLGVLHRDMCLAVSEPAQRAEQYQGMRTAFGQSLALRRRLAGATHDPEERVRYLNRLANTHQEFGRALFLAGEGTALYEQVLWQYQVSRQLNTLYRSDYDPAQVRFLQQLAQMLEASVGEDTRVAARWHVTALLDQYDIPGLEYPLLGPEVKEPRGSDRPVLARKMER